MPREGRNEADYGVVKAAQELAADQIEKYWRDVTETLERVFGDRNAADKVRELRGNLAAARERNNDTELHFYHLDPFQVAADLAGAAHRAVSPAARARYVEMKNLPDNNRPDEAALSRAKPEDLIPSN